VAGPDVISRRAGRVLPIDSRNRVLLLCGFDPADPSRPFWFTVGGGADPGETLAEAAARELREEVGIAAEAGSLGRPVWRRATEFAFDGMRFQQEEEYFALRVGSCDVSLAGMDDLEKDTVSGYRWLSVADFDLLGEPFYPPELPRLLRELTSP
jgi:8-oxo-dGTP pyrophosphatase MutT (NUDIX family)